jgi:hypothetical protein
MVAIEGMLQGTPVIVSDTGGLGELVEHGVTGLKVPAGDAGALELALIRMLSDDATRRSMGERARESVLRDRIWTGACRQTTEVYGKIGTPKRTAKQSRSDRVFVAPGLFCDEEYGIECSAKGYFSEWTQRNGQVTAVTTGDGDLIEMQGITHQEDQLIQAFNMATKLLVHAAHPPSEITSFHWVGALAASVLKRCGDKARHSYISAQIDSPATGTQEQAFQSEMPVWATMQCSNPIVPDEISRQVSAQYGVSASIKAPKLLRGVSSDVADASALRAALCHEDEMMAVTAQRLAPPFSVNAVVASGRAAARAGLRVRWIVCGGGEMEPRLAEAMKKESLAITALGYVPDPVLGAILTVADLAFVPRSVSNATLFAEDAAEHGLTTLVPVGYSANTRRLNGLIEVNFAEQEQLTDAFRKLRSRDALARYRIDEASPDLTRAPVHSRPMKHDFVLFNDWGIGDELLLSGVAREIVRARPDVRIWIRSRHGFRFPPFASRQDPPNDAVKVETIYQNPVLYGPQYHAPFPGHLVQQMLDKFGLDTGIMVRAKETRPALQLPPTTGYTTDVRSVVLHSKPNPRLPTKDWGLERWRALCELLNQAGVRIRQVGSRNEPLLPFALDMRGIPAAELPEVVAASGAVVCVAGLLMHIAAAVNRPAVVIYGGREHPSIDGYPAHVHLCSNPLPCRGRWGCHLGADQVCPHAMRCMDDIIPETVAFEVYSQLTGLQQQDVA